MASLPSDGAMWSVEVSEAEAREKIRGSNVDLAAVNSDSQVVLSGAGHGL